PERGLNGLMKVCKVGLFLSAKQGFLLFHPGTIGSCTEMFERANPSLKKFRLDASGSDSLF
ncbi:MAG: hypothetical protein MK488_07545, partial [SAR324 cluster bacterium]|nr:hypothetical protein [SAR324 cluster bacterium]